MKRLFIIAILLLATQSAIQAQIVKADYDASYKHGFKDKDDNWVVSPQYYHTFWHEKDKFGTFIIQKDGPVGLLDEWGKVIFPADKYKGYYIDTSKTNRYIILEDMDGKWGVTTFDTKIIVPCKYSGIDTYNIDELGLILATEENGLQCVYDLSGKKIFSAKYAGYFFYNLKEQGIIEVINKEGLKGLITENFEELLPCHYSEISTYYYKKYGVITVTNKDGLKAAINGNTGKEIIPFLSADFRVSATYVCIQKEGKEGVYSLDGELIAPCEYESASLAADGIALIKKDGKWGYYAQGKEIIPCIYDYASVFTNDVAKVKKDGLVTLIKNPLKDGSKIQIAGGNTSINNKKQRMAAVSRYPAPDSDVDKNIPMAKKATENTFAFVICNENYSDAPVPFSLNDGRMFREYCQKALGVPEKNINIYEDATFGDIITAVEKMKQIADAYDGEASIIFYYSGHGYPDDKQSTAYLLPIDGDASNITTTGYSLAKLYKEISSLKLKSSVIFLDACFSGAKREDEMLASSRGVAIKVKEEAPQGNMVVFSAAQGDETAHQLEDKHHGLFTYYLLKELQTTQGDADLGTLTDYVTKQVKRQSVVINNKKQTPTVIPSRLLTDEWRSLKLK